MKPFPLPVVTIGPGSQPEDETLQYIRSPGDMSVYSPPTPRAEATPEAIAGARNLLSRLLAMMERDGFNAATRLSLLGEDPGVVREVNELLGSGEVSAVITGANACRIQETAFAGIWRVHAIREDGVLARDDIETGSIPQILREAAARVVKDEVEPTPPPPGVMNAPALINELQDVSARFRAGDEAHVINLTLLPVTPEDLAYLGVELRGGPVTILSRGYGNCRITSTGLPRTWWVQYFNSTDHLILDTIEVVDVPSVALAAPEDFSDSIERLQEWLETV